MASTNTELIALMNLKLPSSNDPAIPAIDLRFFLTDLINSKASSDVINPPSTDGLQEITAATAYTDGETIYFTVNANETNFYHVLQDFTTASPLNIASEIAASNIVQTNVGEDYIQLKNYVPKSIGNGLGAAEEVIFPKDAVVIESSTLKIFRAKIQSTNRIALTNATYWERLGGDVPPVTAADVSVDDSNLVVAKKTNVQDFAESVDHALLKARGTGVNTSYTSSVTVGGTTFSQGEVNAEISSDEGYFDDHFLGDTDVTVANLNATSTFVYIDKDNELQQQTTIPTRQDWVRKVFTMRISVDTSSNTIVNFEYFNNPIGNYSNSIRDIFKYLRAAGVPFKIDMNVTGRTADLGFDIESGSFLEFGGTGQIFDPNTKALTQVSNAEFFLLTKTNSVSGGNTNIPKFWDNNGVITALGSTTCVGHRLYRDSFGDSYIQYGQGNYANMTLAKAGAKLEQYIVNPILKDANFLGWWLIESTATATSGTVKAEFVEYTIGIQGGSSSSLSGAFLIGNNFSEVLDAAIARTNLGFDPLLAALLPKLLAEDSFFQGNSSGEAAAVASFKFYPQTHKGTTLFNQAYLIANWSAFKLIQKIENNWQIAERVLDSGNWLISKKNPNELIVVDANLATIWNGQNTKVLDLSTLIGADVVNLNTTIPTLAVTGVTLTGTNAVKVLVQDDTIKYLKNGDEVDFNSVVGTTELNGNNYIIENIVYTAGSSSIDLNGTDSSNFTAWSSGGVITFTSGIFLPQIESVINMPDNNQITIQSKANENPTFLKNVLATATTNEIITVGNVDITLIGKTQGSDMLTLTKKGSFLYASNHLVYTA